MSDVLFIGGANDGTRMKFTEDGDGALPFIRLPLPPVWQSSWEVEAEFYRRERMATRNKVFEFYVSESISLETAIKKLLEGYSPSK